MFCICPVFKLCLSFLQDVKPVISTATSSIATSVSTTAMINIKTEPRMEALRPTLATSFAQTEKTPIQADFSTASTDVKTSATDATCSSAGQPVTKPETKQVDSEPGNLQSGVAVALGFSEKSTDSALSKSQSATTEKEKAEDVLDVEKHASDKHKAEPDFREAKTTIDDAMKISQASEKMDEKPELDVSFEHSYVKSHEDAKTEISDNCKVVAPSSAIQRSISASSDGHIHGVGLTPPPIAAITGASLEDGVIVSNVVVVDKDNEKKAEETQQSSPKCGENAALKEAAGEKTSMFSAAATVDVSEKYDDATSVLNKEEKQTKEKNRPESAFSVKDKTYQKAVSLPNQAPSTVDTAVGKKEINDTVFAKTAVSQQHLPQEKPLVTASKVQPGITEPAKTRTSPSEGLGKLISSIESSKIVATVAISIAGAKTLSTRSQATTTYTPASESTSTTVVISHAVSVTSQSDFITSQSTSFTTSQVANVTSVSEIMKSQHVITPQSPLATSQPSIMTSESTTVTLQSVVAPAVTITSTAGKMLSEVTPASTTLNQVAVSTVTAPMQDDVQLAIRSTGKR